MTVLVLTRPTDSTADGVVAELERRGVTVVRGDVGDFPIEAKIVASLADHREWRGSFRIAGNSVPLSEIRAIYYRRPTGFRLPDHLAPEQQRFAKREARRGLGGLLLTLPVRWVSHPSRVADAEFKPLQLQLAASCGLITDLLKRFNLSFGAFDFTITPEGKWVFLEINPNGQWGWIEERTGLPITSAMAGLLTDEAAE